jgi:hypothetical protein
MSMLLCHSSSRSSMVLLHCKRELKMCQGKHQTAHTAAAAAAPTLAKLQTQQQQQQEEVAEMLVCLQLNL